MNRLRRLSVLGFTSLVSASLAAGLTVQASPPQGQTAARPAVPPAPPALPTVCLDARTSDPVTSAFADRLREAIAESSALSLASTSGSCSLELHVPGNLLRFDTAGGVMVSTVVIVTSQSDHYLSASVGACLANDLKPCAVRAVAAAKLAVLMKSNDGT